MPTPARLLGALLPAVDAGEVSRLLRHRAGAATALARRRRELARLGDLAERRRAGRRRTRVGRVVHVVEPEPRLEALGPLEVVEQAPVVVAAHVHAFVTCLGDLLERSHDVLRASLAVLRREAGFA